MLLEDGVHVRKSNITNSKGKTHSLEVRVCEEVWLTTRVLENCMLAEERLECSELVPSGHQLRSRLKEEATNISSGERETSSTD